MPIIRVYDVGNMTTEFFVGRVFAVYFYIESIVEQYPGSLLEREMFMANEEQLSVLKQGVDAWNKWRSKSAGVNIDLSGADLRQAFLSEVQLGGADLSGANLRVAALKSAFLRGANLKHAGLTGAILDGADLVEANLLEAKLGGASLRGANLRKVNLRNAKLYKADLTNAILDEADLSNSILVGASLNEARLSHTNFKGADLLASIFSKAMVSETFFGNSDLSGILGLETIRHTGPSNISTETFVLSKGNISEVFLRGCGLSDLDIEYSKLSNPDLSNEEINKILYKIYDLRATQALQISPLFISYSHANSIFVDKLESHLNKEGVRFWRDIHEMKSGRMEKQIDRAIRQNPTVLLVLSEYSLSSDWVEHEVRTARELEKDMRRDVLCPVALDDSWKNSHWPKRVMEQIMEYNVLDFSEWQNDNKFDDMFRKLIDGLELFYKG